MKGSIESRVKAVVADYFHIPRTKLTLDAAFVDDLGADALDVVELLYAFESAFNTSIPLAIRDTLTTPRDVVDYLRCSSRGTLF